MQIAGARATAATPGSGGDAGGGAVDGGGGLALDRLALAGLAGIAAAGLPPVPAPACSRSRRGRGCADPAGG